MKEKLTLFTVPYCSYCVTLKEKLNKENIPFFNFDVEENRTEWLQIVGKIGVDILPTVYIIEENKEVGTFYIPGKDFKSEDEIFDIIIKHIKM